MKLGRQDEASRRQDEIHDASAPHSTTHVPSAAGAQPDGVAVQAVPDETHAPQIVSRGSTRRLQL